MELDMELYDKLKRQFPELEEGVVKEALVLYGNNFDGARKALQDKYYGDEKAIEQEVSLWSTIFGETESGRTDDWSIEALTDGVAQLGMQLIQGMDSVADAIGTIGDLIPDLIFGDDDEEAQAELRHMASRDKQGQVVVGGSRGRGVKKRGAHNAAPAPGTAPLKSNDELDDEETDDWTKED